MASQMESGNRGRSKLKPLRKEASIMEELALAFMHAHMPLHASHSVNFYFLGII